MSPTECRQAKKWSRTKFRGNDRSIWSISFLSSVWFADWSDEIDKTDLTDLKNEGPIRLLNLTGPSFLAIASFQILRMNCATSSGLTAPPMIDDIATLVDFLPVRPDSTSSTINSTGMD